MVKYSDHYTVDGTDETTITLPSILVPHMATTLEDATAATGPGCQRGVGSSRLRYKRAFISMTDPDSNDQLFMMTFHSSDRISHLMLSGDGNHTTATNVDVGIYLTGDTHDGAVQDVDLYNTALDLTAANDRIECFTTGILTGLNRGQPIWETLSTGALSLTEDPEVLYDLCLTFTTDAAGTGLVVLEAYYSSGD